MARIILSGLLQDMTGSAGANVYSKWKGLHYFRLKAASVSNPNTEKQAGIRTQLTTMVRKWSGLTLATRAMFSEYAEAHGYTRNKENQMGSKSLITPVGRLMSGLNAYVSMHGVLAGAGQFIPKTTPPLYKGEVVKTFSAKFNVPGGPGTVNLLTSGALAGLASGATCYVTIWLEALAKGSHKYISKTITIVPPASGWTDDILATLRVGHGAEISEVPWFDIYGEPGNTVNPPGPYADKVIIKLQCRAITSDGAVGTATATLQIPYTHA